MNLQDFHKSLITFADAASDLDLAKGKLMVQIRDEVIEATVEESQGDIFVTENGERTRAFTWLTNRVARLPQLADRILAHINDEPHFITPSGKLLDHLNERPEDKEYNIQNVPDEMLKLLSLNPAGTSRVLYVTSDAGEGKTTLINEMARRQAEKYKEKKTDWLLLPISLGGRSFMTFDDIVVAELVNRFRFQLLYYDAFLGLVRRRVLVPAFDGFEEMFVEGSTGEAASALGNLMRGLESSGSVLIAARKAYFEYQNFQDQAKLFDAVSGNDVTFARVSLDRWDRRQFLKYANLRELHNKDDIYERVSARLGVDHPLLTRAVLAKRLVDVGKEGDVDDLLEHLGANPEDYFYQFVNTIIEREAKEKWVDRSGTPYQPLLTINEHHALLALIAKEMWITLSEILSGDYLDLIAELFAGDLGKSPQITMQIVKRLKQHSLIAPNTPNSTSYIFDHEDFRKFYLGEALGKMLSSNKQSDLTAFLQKAALPVVAADSALNAAKRYSADLTKTRSLLQSLVDSAAPTSYVMENAGVLTSRLLELLSNDDVVTLRGFTFPSDALKGRKLGQVIFEKCQFQGTSLEDARINQCRFTKCTIHRLEWLENFDAKGAVIEKSTITSVVSQSEPGGRYDPEGIKQALTNVNFEVIDPEVDPVNTPVKPDEKTQLAENALRIFMRATQINERVLRQRLGTRAKLFFTDVLPRMLDQDVLAEVPYKGKGKGNQQRFKLCVPMRNIDSAVPATVGSLDEFLASVLSGKVPNSQ